MSFGKYDQNVKLLAKMSVCLVKKNQQGRMPRFGQSLPMMSGKPSLATARAWLR